MSHCYSGCAELCVGFPRVSGDEPVKRGVYKYSEEFSPRERG